MENDSKNMVLNNDGKTYRHAGTMQWQMTPAQQKEAGLIAKVNRSIHGREVKTGDSK